MEKNQTDIITARIPHWLRILLDEFAANHKYHRSRAIEVILEKWLRK